MIRWNELNSEMRESALERPLQDENATIMDQVTTILNDVKLQGDSALESYTRRFDGVNLKTLRVAEEEIRSAAARLDTDVKTAIDQAYGQIKAFHEFQLQETPVIESVPGVKCSLRIRPFESVGLYVPGGKTPLPSTALMLGVPAQLAGCPEIVLVTPPGSDGRIADEILYVADICGVRQIFMIGGAQAIAGLAYGTESMPKVDKIFGPGNRYVTAAKQQVVQEGLVAIDMPAGPSEVLIIADNQANPTFVAIDLLSQAEHGEDSQVVLLSDSEEFISSVMSEVIQLVPALPRNRIITKSLLHARYILVDSIDQAVDVSNRYAPEHLIVQIEDPESILEDITHAGSIFLGPWTPESAGDYASGTNHVLPTYGAARFTSSLGLADFQKRSTVQQLSRDGLLALGTTIMTLAASEGLGAHEQAVALRLKEAGA